MTAYYNENDPFAAAWLRELVAAGRIAPGHVDERDIRDVEPTDLAGYRQCHFFAGIGVWSHALRLAGVSDNAPVWTGSCPCQPFSAAGRGGGFADERHLWPHWFDLIRVCRPAVVLGEQVASKDGLSWLDLVQADLEGAGYACGAVDLCAAGVGAPHIRQRLWFVAQRLADANRTGHQSVEGNTGICGADDGPRATAIQQRPDSATGGMADTDSARSQGFRRQSGELDIPQGWQEPAGRAGTGGVAGGLAESECFGRQRRQGIPGGSEHDRQDAGRLQGQHGPVGVGKTGDDGLADADGGDTGAEGLQRSGQHGIVATDGGAGRETGGGAQADPAGNIRRPGPADGFWRDADWLYCRDGKWRPVEPGTFPLVTGAAARVGRLRGYGNALNAEAAAAFVEAALNYPGRDAMAGFVDIFS